MVLFDLNEELIEYCTDCKQYHEYSVWVRRDNRYFLQDMTGDRFEISRASLDDKRDAQEEVRRAYLEEVAETGDDYLMWLIVTRSEEQEWLLGYVEELDGVRFSRGKRVEWAGWVTATDPRIPEAVRTYATGQLDGSLYIDGFQTMDELIAFVQAGEYQGSDIFRAVIGVTVSDEVIRERLREAARAALTGEE